jgi:polyphosphate:AMP phosphotransferase
MFEAAELGQKITKQAFDAAEPGLRTALLQAQREIRAAGIPVIVLVSGVEGAGKGEVVNRLDKWLDTRWVRMHAFWDETAEETERPRHWRFWRRLPEAGSIGILFGSWYAWPIVERAFERMDKDSFEHELWRIAEFERLLCDGGALLVKFWFHLSARQQKKRLQDDIATGRITSPLLERHARRYDEFVRTSERALRATDVGAAPWHIVEASDRRFRDLTVGQTLLRAMRQRLANGPPAAAPPPTPAPAPPAGKGLLAGVDLTARLEEDDYELQLRYHQHRINRLTWLARDRKRSTIAVFEGWDAAGKGGAIRRITDAADARLYRTISVAAPTDEERSHHYLWRFWRHLPRAGYMTLYDRSWYGRVLVERVEGFASPREWQRAYQEINDFEEQLVSSGIVLLKFWLQIDREEQLRRFEDRQVTPWKRHKITAEDWRNRDKWDAYEAAVEEMLARTSSSGAPWLLIPGNDKRYARIAVLTHVCERLQAALGG